MITGRWPLPGRIPDSNRPVSVRLGSPFVAILVDILLGGGLECGRFLEIGEEMVPVPADIPQLPPSIVVCSGPAVKGHAVDGRASADHLSDSEVGRTVSQMDLRDRDHVIQTLRLVVRGEERDGDVGGVGKVAIFDNQDRLCPTSVSFHFSSPVGQVRDYSNVLVGSSLNRLATVNPLVPPPTTM